MSIVLGLIGRFWSTSRPERVRRDLKSNLELYSSLHGDQTPEQTSEQKHTNRYLDAGQERLAWLIRDQISYLDELERKAMQREYDPSQPVIAALFGVPLGYGAYLAWEARDDWYMLALAFVLAMSVVMFIWLGISGFFTPPAQPKDKKAKDKAKGEKSQELT